ncbi:MAG: DAK2 domain-containing protein [Clostridia bacterium]|nr:DAK2 domain-containing protein [Clostridia bacterium]
MISGAQLRDAVISASNCLVKEKQNVDALNVFPVPDGDTGTNMSMTLQNAAREVARLGDDCTATQVADVTAAAVLRGARGNSGVITSLLFRGFSKGLKGKETASGADLALALTIGVEEAYKAVMKPTEGTILTVSREAAAAGKALGDGSVSDVWEAICVEAEASLNRTPEILPVLKKAGVVVAGGKGFVLIIRAMQQVFEGNGMVEGDAPSAAAPQKRQSAVALADEEITFTYCTEFIVRRDPKATRQPIQLRAFLESIGDCVVVVDDEEIIKVHVHTNDPGRALHEAIEFGQFETVKVENMRIQHENAGWVEEEDTAAANAGPARVEPEEPFGFVSVAAGEGIQALFADLGCAQIVSGGQTMNPSTDDILQAIEATPAKVVYVLPNNKNIILAAEQAVPLADRKVHVLPTRTIPQGISAMLAFDPDADEKTNLLGMTRAADNVSTGQVTFAARDSSYDGKAIKKGDMLALDNGKVAFTEADPATAIAKLAKNIVKDRKQAGKTTEFMTLLYGEGMTETDAEAAAEAIRAKISADIDVTVVDGGQPVYYYILSVE